MPILEFVLLACIVFFGLLMLDNYIARRRTPEGVVVGVIGLFALSLAGFCAAMGWL